MARITDPDDLRLSSQSSGAVPDGEVFIDKNDLTIELMSKTEFDNVSGSSNFTATEGVTLQALYSFLKNQWKNNDTDDFYNYRFPMEAITAEQFEFINDWKPKNDTVRSYIRTGGWEEKDQDSGSSRQAWMGVITLGNILSNQTAYYYWQDVDGSALETTYNSFTYNGPVNEPVKIYGDLANGNFDYRTGRDLVVRIRPAPTGAAGSVTGYTYDSSDTNAIGTPLAVTTQVYRFPLTSAEDPKITITDASAVTLASDIGFQLQFDQTALSSSILTTDLVNGPHDFTHLIDSTSVTNLAPEDIYHVVQYKLRQDTGAGKNINDDATSASAFGVLTEELVTFVGDTLQTFAIGVSDNEGILINDIDQTKLGNYAFRDNTNTLQVFPAIASGTLTFSDTLKNDPATRYWMFYQSASVAGIGSAPWPGANAVVVDDNNGTDIAGYYHVQGTASFSSNTATGSITAGTKILNISSDVLTAGAHDGRVLRLKTGNNIGFYFISTNSQSSVTISGDKNFETTDNANTVEFDIYPKNTGTIQWTFDYTGTGNRNDGFANTPAGIQLVALGLDNAQYVETTGTITSATGQNFSITAPLERNYNDPE